MNTPLETNTTPYALLPPHLQLFLDDQKLHSLLYFDGKLWWPLTSLATTTPQYKLGHVKATLLADNPLLTLRLPTPAGWASPMDFSGFVTRVESGLRFVPRHRGIDSLTLPLGMFHQDWHGLPLDRKLYRN